MLLTDFLSIVGVPTPFTYYLHNIGDIYGNVPVTFGDALLTDPGYRVDYVPHGR